MNILLLIGLLLASWGDVRSTEKLQRNKFFLSYNDTIPAAALPDTLPAPALPDTLPQPALPDSLMPVLPDTLLIPVELDTIPQPVENDTIPLQTFEPVEEPEEVRQDTVHVWRYHTHSSFETAETDSTLRWVNMLNLFDRFHRQRGAVTYRMGTVGRMDGLELHAFESRHLGLEMEGMNINDPLTGAVNWNRLTFHKISEFNEMNYGGIYRAETRLRDHYLIQPRTYLNFDESKFNYRSLEFSYTQNLRKNTNLELSFWDRRDGAGYNRQDVEGRQIVARVYHQLNHNWLVKAGYINNVLERQESFGYNITDPQFFAFNRFIEIPIQNSANAEQKSSDVYVQLHHRTDTTRTVSTKFGLHYQNDDWDLTYNADTLATSFRNVELFARQKIGKGSTQLTGTARAFALSEREGRNLTETSWFGGNASVRLTQKLAGFAQADASIIYTVFDDSRTTNDASARIKISPFKRTSLSVFGGYLSRAPDIQAAYWQSAQFTGNSELLNEESLLYGAEARVGLSRTLQLGVRGDMRETEHATFVNSDGIFENIDPYSMVSGTAWLALDSRRFEGEISGTYNTFSSTGSNPINQQLNGSGDRIWLRGNLYWKNYLFNRATFVKAGVSGMFSPNAYRTAEFFTPLNRWQHGTNEFINPSFYRLDFDLSARVRWFMLLLKWENILDRIDQLGYFESVGYPMPEMRFRFGIRVLFTN